MVRDHFRKKIQAHTIGGTDILAIGALFNSYYFGGQQECTQHQHPGNSKPVVERLP